MNQRAGDGETLVKVTREIPLAWLLGIAGLMIGQAATVWFTQKAQGDAIVALTVEIKEMRASMNAGNMKAIEHDVRISDHERRIQGLELSRNKQP